MTLDLASRLTLGPDAIGRIVRALVAEELGAQRGRAIPHADVVAWDDAATIDEEEGGLGVDSLARLNVVGRVNEFFHLHETGIEDYLLVRRSLGDWTELVGESLRRSGDQLTFQTSGSTGEPKRVVHPVADLAQEVEALAALAPDRRRVLALVPPHHIYGFLFTDKYKFFPRKCCEHHNRWDSKTPRRFKTE